MHTWKIVVLGTISSSLLWLAACEQPEEEQTPQLSPTQQCYEECTQAVEKTRAECREKLLEEGALDRMMGCNTAADARTETCRAACDKKLAGQ